MQDTLIAHRVISPENFKIRHGSKHTYTQIRVRGKRSKNVFYRYAKRARISGPLQESVGLAREAALAAFFSRDTLPGSRKEFLTRRIGYR